MIGITGSRRFSLADVALYLVGVAGLAMCLTLVWLSMRAVMNVGGFCAEGGPYVIETPCPAGTPLAITIGIFGLFVFGGLVVWKGAAIGGRYAGLVALAWPALFISLGWNFLEYAFNPPGPPGQGIVWGWLIPGVVFIVMGAGPLLLALDIGKEGLVGSARTRAANRIAPDDRYAPRANRQKLVNDLQAAKENAEDAADLVTKLERLSALREAGDLTSGEFEDAKRAILRQVRAT
ncbi:MAG TPA: hypothetical protein VMZ33_08300 [Candidatus Limnocylindrales bacterium]|nr:hypothetical protein [Candidatus Limnocylindrales bacterium]